MNEIKSNEPGASDEVFASYLGLTAEEWHLFTEHGLIKVGLLGYGTVFMKRSDFAQHLAGRRAPR
jgi:hypothetical protein